MASRRESGKRLAVRRTPIEKFAGARRNAPAVPRSRQALRGSDRGKKIFFLFTASRPARVEEAIIERSERQLSEDSIRRETIDVQGVKTEMLTGGTGDTGFLFLHPERGMRGSETFLRKLAATGHVIAPHHPGYRLDAPDHFKSVDDLSYFYLDLMDALDLRNMTLIGASLGGWLAMEIASKNTARMSSLCLLSPAGVKTSDRTSRDIVDIFSLDAESAEAMSFHDPNRFATGIDTSDDMELELVARAREASARYAWLPYMHNPKLSHRLHRIDIPTFIIWGNDDRMAPPSVGHALARRLPRGEFYVLDSCGHYPHIEFAETVAAQISKWREQHVKSAPDAVKGAA